MFENLLICNNAKVAIDSYLKNVSGGLILLGSKGIGKSLYAKQIAASILGCDESKLSTHLDYYYCTAVNNVVTIEQMRELRERCSMVANGDKKVLIVDDAQYLTFSAQNAILKVLEDDNKTNIIIFVTSEPLLPTIHSRTTVITVEEPERDEVAEYIKKKDGSVNQTALIFSMCRMGLYYQMLDEKGFISYAESILSVMEKMKNKREWLEILHCLKEKDSNNFFDKFDQVYVNSFFSVLKEVCESVLKVHVGYEQSCQIVDIGRLMELYSVLDVTIILQVLEDHLMRMKHKGAYSKNDFFDFVRILMA